MLCSKCHKNEAIVHFTCVVQGETETFDLCQGCAQATSGFGSLDPKDLEALSVAGKKCEFCGQAAESGAMDAAHPVFWCSDCGMEFGRILADLCEAERPDLLHRAKEAASFLSVFGDPDFRAWSQAAQQKAVQMLRERRRQDGRDKGS